MPYRFIRHLLLILGLILNFGKLYSQTTDQNYPVTASAFIVAQPNQKLSTYFSSSQALSVTLLLKDLTKPSLQVYLKWSIDGPGVHVASIDGYIPPVTLTLDKGMLKKFSGLDLQNDYFRNNLIEQQGLEGNALRTSLPEGFYTFRVQALEAGTGREVSNVGETYFSITTPLPPVINIPFNGTNVTTLAGASLTTPIPIQWMPRHYKQAGNITSYDLKVCKVLEGYEPTEALDACVNPTIDDHGNPGTFYPGNTGIGNTIIGAWEVGARYAIRVTIHEFDQNGDEVVFANEGRSEVTWFTYGTPCVSPENFTILETGPGRLHLSWTADGGSKSYRVLYRKEGEKQLMTQAVTGTSIGLVDLKPGKHEVAVQSECTEIIPANLQIYNLEEDQINNTTLPQITRVDGFSVDSLIAVLDSLPIPCASQISTYKSCEADHPLVSPSGLNNPATESLVALNPGDILSIYDMAVIVTESNGTSPFSGKGLARLPYMQNALTPVEFSDVLAWKGQPGTRGGCVYKVGGYFRSYALAGEVVPDNPDNQDQDTIRATIQYVVVNPIESNTASIGWRGDKSFARYTLKYKMESGGELQKDVTNPKMILVNLREAKNYTFTIDAYGTDGTLLDSYGPSSFTTTTEGIAMPQNLHPVWNDSSGVLTWDKDLTHIGYKLIYKDRDGLDKTLYPTTNSVILPGLDSLFTYPFTLVAVGKSDSGSELVSDPVSGAFNARISSGDTGGTGSDADDFNDGRDLNEVTITGQTDWTDFFDLFNGYFDEPPMTEDMSFVHVQMANPANPMSKPIKKIESYDRFKQLKCPGESDLVAAHKYKIYVVGELFKGLVHVAEGTGEVIADISSALAQGLVGFLNTLFEKVDASQSTSPTRSLDEIFAEVYYQMTIVEYLNTPNSSGIYPEIQACTPSPSWIKSLRECELTFIKNEGSPVHLPVLMVNSEGEAVDVVNARQTASGDYYYMDTAKGVEYWKLQGTYLVGKVNNKNWIYWNIYVNKWCGFTPGGSMEMRVTETVNVCDDMSVSSLNGEIKVRVLNGQGPYQYSVDDGEKYSSTAPFFTFSDIGGSVVDLKVQDSKGCEAVLKGQYLQTVPSNTMDVAIKLRKCNNSVILEAVCGTGPFKYSMDGKTYQSSNEFKDIQKLIGAPMECDNGISKSFTFFIKDARGMIAHKTVEIKRNDYVSVGVRKLKGQKFPGYEDETFVLCGGGLDYKDYRHVNKSSGVLISHTEKFCEEVKGSIRLTSKMTVNSAAPYTYRLFGSEGLITTVVTETPGYKFDDLAPGTYHIEGEDGEGCAVESFFSRKTWSGYDTRDIEIVDAGLTAQIITQPPTCFDGIGEIDISVKGGAFKRDLGSGITSWGGYWIPSQKLFVNNTYVDNLSKNTELRGDLNFPANNLTLYRPVGTYDIRVTDYLGCSVQQRVNFTAPPALEVTADVTPATKTTSGSVHLDVKGGTPPYSEFSLRGPGIRNLNQDIRTFTNLLPGGYVAQVTDSKGCKGQEHFIIGEPIKLAATVTDVTCIDDGIINLQTTGGVPPFQFSIDGTSYQENPIFNKLEAGSYTLTVKDSQNGKTTTKATVKEPETYLVVPGVYSGNMRVTAGSDEPIEEGFIRVSYDETSRKTTFKLKAGFDMKLTSSGIWILTVTSNDPEEKKYEGKYQAYFNDCDVNMFIGFYRLDPTNPDCTPDKWKEKATTKMLCKERWLPESEYAEIVKNIMIFANGYRFYGKGAAGILINSPKEYAFTNNTITNDAVQNYWATEDPTDINQTDMDLKFVERRKPDVVYYVDGHHSITTSNHNVAGDVSRSMKEKFIPGMVGSMMAKYPDQDPVWPAILPYIAPYTLPIITSWGACYQNEKCVTLSTTSNTVGFDTRVQSGRYAFEALISKLAKIKKPAGAKVTYHIDVVAHSMGFAYAQGIIEALKRVSDRGDLSVTWGGYYIIAPENGSAGTVNPGDWEQIWQYGSDYGRTDGIAADPLWDQDGIAPQFGVNGLDDQRVYIPKNQNIPKGYIESHRIGNYGWIFEIKPEQGDLSKGYVKPK